MSRSRNRNKRRKAKMRMSAPLASSEFLDEIRLHLKTQRDKRRLEREAWLRDRNHDRQMRKDIIAIHGIRFYKASGNYPQIVSNMMYSDFKPDSSLGFTKR